MELFKKIMKIIESDCYIDYINGVYHLYLLKNKKELKEDDDNTHRIGGYYTNIDSAFKEIIRFRQHKKYPFKEDWKQIKLILNTYLKSKKQFNLLLCKLYHPIIQFKNELFVYKEHKINYWK